VIGKKYPDRGGLRRQGKTRDKLGKYATNGMVDCMCDPVGSIPAQRGSSILSTTSRRPLASLAALVALKRACEPVSFSELFG